MAVLVSVVVTGCILCCCCHQPSASEEQATDVKDDQRQRGYASVWVVVALGFLMLFAVFNGIRESQNMESTVSSILCNAARLVDTALNGGMSEDRTTFFTGVSTIEKILYTMVGNVTSAVGNFSKYLPDSLLRIQSLGRRLQEDL